MEDQVVGAGSRKSDEELAQVGRVRGHDTDQCGARDMTIGDGAHERGSHERMCEVVHATTSKVGLLRLLVSREIDGHDHRARLRGGTLGRHLG